MPFLEIAALEAMANDGRDMPLDRPHRTVMARVLGIPQRQLYRWLSYGVTLDQADELAAMFELNPAQLWPDIQPTNQRKAEGGRGGTSATSFAEPAVGHGHIRRRGESYEVRVYLPKRIYGWRGYATVSVADLAEAEQLRDEGVARAARGEAVVLPRRRQPRWRGMVRQRGLSSWEVRVYLGRDGDGRKRYFTRTVHEEQLAQRLRTGVMLELEETGATGDAALRVARAVDANLRPVR